VKVIETNKIKKLPIFWTKRGIVSFPEKSSTKNKKEFCEKINELPPGVYSIKLFSFISQACCVCPWQAFSA
jgi:hypothetical protein